MGWSIIYVRGRCVLNSPYYTERDATKNLRGCMYHMYPCFERVVAAKAEKRRPTVSLDLSSEMRQPISSISVCLFVFRTFCLRTQQHARPPMITGLYVTRRRNKMSFFLYARPLSWHSLASRTAPVVHDNNAFYLIIHLFV